MVNRNSGPYEGNNITFFIFKINVDTGHLRFNFSAKGSSLRGGYLLD